MAKKNHSPYKSKFLKGSQKYAPKDNPVENDQIELIEQVRAFEDFQAEVLPMLRDDLKKGLSASEIYKKYANMAAARGITIALTETDSGKALTAIKDVIDRTQGRATEKKEVKHKFEELPEEELDAILKSELTDVEEDYQ